MYKLLRSLEGLPLPLLALAAVASATNLQLSQVQPIIGFSSSCTSAYSTRLPSCSFDDLLASVGGKNGGCSVTCISQLTELQSFVQSSCQGERAGRDTVIGQIFTGTVIGFLCGDDVGGGQSATSSSASTMTTATTSMSTAEPADTTTTSDTTTSEEPTTTTDSIASTSATSTTSESSTIQDSSSSAAQATASNGANQGGQGDSQTNFGGSGGGSPFDGGPGEFDGAAPRLTLRHNPIMLLTLLASMLLVR